jgi:hypothetical protein
MTSNTTAQPSIPLVSLRPVPNDIPPLLSADRDSPPPNDIISLLRDAEARRAQIRLNNTAETESHSDNTSDVEEDQENTNDALEREDHNSGVSMLNNVDYRNMLLRGRRPNKRRRRFKKMCIKIWKFFYAIYIYITSTISFVWGYRQYQALNTSSTQANQRSAHLCDCL